jgi:DNA-binding CsgD family transcriptional regulator
MATVHTGRMAAELDWVGRFVPAVAADVATVPELGSAISGQLGRLVPHDGYLLRGLDPLTGAGCLLAAEHGYSSAAARRLELNERGGRDLHSLASLVTGTCPVGVLGSGSSRERHSERLHEIMAAEGFGSEMRIALQLAGVTWGVLALLRERGRKPFSAPEAALAERLSTPVAAAVKRFVAGKRLRRMRCALAPGVIVVSRGDRIRATSSTVREWLGRLVPDPATADDDELFGNVWNIALAARQNNVEALSRIPTSQGWIVLRGQLLDGPESGEVVVTVQQATADVLLPALAAFYGITSREQAVINQALDGIPTKQIATRLHVSPHTVNDHFRAIYRKTGLSGRDELIAGLSR